jgi:hypothetical protein
MIGRVNDIAGHGLVDVQLHDDDVAGCSRLPDAAAQAAQVWCFSTASSSSQASGGPGHPHSREFAIASAREAIRARIAPDSSNAMPFGVLVWRAHAATRILRH